jgi:bis(5'-nucleosyl)-tetraphosphatase (symmetrical)
MHYAIGDVQGCLTELVELLQLIKFNAVVDSLWFCGDLVNRGPDSLGVLRFISALPRPPVIVLGNHDLHLLAVVEGLSPIKSYESLDQVIDAADCKDLCLWLRQQKLAFYSLEFNCLLVHAGLAPGWDIQTASACALEIESVLKGSDYSHFLSHMYGDKPNAWDPNVSGVDRWRLVTNILTRIRLCTQEGALDFKENGTLESAAPHLQPWFTWFTHADFAIIFGHWAALNGKTNLAHVHGLDTGCVWGNALTAMCLETGKKYQVKAKRNYCSRR